MREQRWVVRVQDVYQALLDYKPQIVHFSGHGAGESVELAYKLGCSVIQLDGIPEHLTPVLLKK